MKRDTASAFLGDRSVSTLVRQRWRLANSWVCGEKTAPTRRPRTTECGNWGAAR